MSLNSLAVEPKKSRVRYEILVMLFVVTTLNYADRATLSIVGTDMSKELGLDSVMLGYVFSAFGWAYVLGQIPGGWLLDRYGSKNIYALTILLWSVFTLLHGYVGSFSGKTAVILLFALSFMVGLCKAPSFPANSRIVAAWFPTKERGTASAIFSSAQYCGTAFFAPIMGSVTYTFGWKYTFIFIGVLGIILSGIWNKVIYNPKEHPRISSSELAYVEQGGALVNLDDKAIDIKQADIKKGAVWQLLNNRMLLGVYLGQYCITTLSYFFLTWFPVYLVTARGMTILEAGFAASIPAICGFVGGVLGGILSDLLLKRGYSLSIARKTPIVIGMILSMSIVFSNYVGSQGLIIFFMALSFFGKGLGALGWAVVSDTSPKEIAGLSGGVFNTFGNVAGITTPIIIGYILHATGSFNGALFFVGAHAFIAIVAYVLIVGEIKRLELKEV